MNPVSLVKLICSLVLLGVPAYLVANMNQLFLVDRFWFSILLLIFCILLSRIRGSEVIRIILLTIGLLSCFRYITWRYLNTINTDNFFNTIASSILLLAETHNCLMFSLVCFQAWKLEKSKSKEPEVNEDYKPEVDIFILTYNEDEAIVRRTIAGALSIDYPNREIYLLDDGRRQSMLDLAERMGCNYITRPNNKHAKAGNINNALEQTHAELVLILDADQIPTTTILKEMVPYFEDKKVGLVQTAQKFMNPGPVEKNLHLEGKLPGEQELFFQSVQPGKNAWNAAFFAGSSALIRRGTLEQLGGMAKRTVTEDCEFTIEMHAKGYKSIYLPTPQAVGLNPESLSAYVIQQTRWARGTMQMCRWTNPFLMWGLSLSQRLCYFTNIVYYLFGIPRLIFVIIPATFLIFSIRPLSVSFTEYVAMAVPYYIVYLLCQNYVFEKFRHSFWSDVYEVLMAPFHAMNTTWTLLRPGSTRFNVTPKGLQKSNLILNFSIVFPHLVLITYCLMAVPASVIWSIFSAEPTSLVINIVWNTYNIIVLFCAILVALERPQSRRAHRIIKEIPLTVSTQEENPRTFGANTVDVNEYGVKIVLPEETYPFKKDDRVVLSLNDTNENLIEIEGRLVRNPRRDRKKRWLMEIEFLDLDKDIKALSQFISLCYCDSKTWMIVREPIDRILTSFWEVVSSPIRVITNTRAFERTLPAMAIVVPEKFFQPKFWPEKLHKFVALEDDASKRLVENKSAEKLDQLRVEEDQLFPLITEEDDNEIEEESDDIFLEQDEKEDKA